AGWAGGEPETRPAGLGRGGGPAPAPRCAEGAAPRVPDPAALRSTMSGTVVKWLVEDGATVAEGDALLVLEAMKMESTVVAHRSGIVVGLLVVPGDTVTLHAVVAGIEA
ncbi:MAG: acetyl-CoA carboxylase biotin carboxyl carrier protein subunit, partial [Cryobacterium sp.]|uniref:acetyl-CoA carboxylase biotin carboxyl carrier protein subunit n=1 Tax=Cryobacterium sp. TaxID=1926290 RepID=UPI00229CB2E6